MESSLSDLGFLRASLEYTTVWSSPPKRPAGRTKFRETRHPIYRGVRRRGSTNRWVCEVRELNKRSRIWLGTFPTAEMAARAHDVAAIALRGHAACLNFTDSAWLINMPSSFSSVQDLKRMAIEVAKVLNGAEKGESMTEALSTSASQTSDEAEVASAAPSSDEEVTESDGFHQMEFHLDGDDEMSLGLYYWSLAEALLMEPPMGDYGCCNENEENIEVTLWS